MSLVERVHYILQCDNCPRTFGYFPAEQFSPQDVLITASLKYHWSVRGERAHCIDCPPLEDDTEFDACQPDHDWDIVPYNVCRTCGVRDGDL